MPTGWWCPNCDAAARTVTTRIPMHPCPGLKGLMAPLVREGVSAKVEAVERGDWVGSEAVQTDGEGRPVMAVVTIREDGQDCTVFAPTATASGGG